MRAIALAAAGLIAVVSGGRLAVAAPEASGAAADRESGVVRGADELFWVPTLEQALDAARETGKPIFVMAYSLVDERSTFSKSADDMPACVF